MTTDEILAEKIKNRTTGLQSVYDMAIKEKQELESEILILKQKLSIAIKRIESCKARAEELNMSHVL